MTAKARKRCATRQPSSALSRRRPPSVGFCDRRRPVPAAADPLRRANPTPVRPSEVPDARGRHRRHCLPGPLVAPLVQAVTRFMTLLLFAQQFRVLVVAEDDYSL